MSRKKLGDFEETKKERGKRRDVIYAPNIYSIDSDGKITDIISQVKELNSTR